MGPKNGRRVRKIKVPTDSITKFELGDIAADIQQRREEREARKVRRHRAEEARVEEATMEETHQQKEGVAEIKGKRER